jgi:hypothetical protein
MKSGQRVVGMQADQCSKGRHRRCIAGLQPGEGLDILRGGRRPERHVLKRLKSTERLAASAQHNFTDGSSLKIAGGLGCRCTDANSGAEILVGCLEPGCGIDGIAVRGVVEEPTAAKVADQRGPRMDTDARGTKLNPLFFQRSRNIWARMSRL